MIKTKRKKPPLPEIADRRIVGLTIEYFEDGKGGWATMPDILLDNGQHIRFSVQETDVGEYGVEIRLTKATR